ncbi:alpha/beta hydrolase [Mycoplasmopsis bovis]|uniref:Esterase/lipase 2 n=2 Tax=Mycoplasmopsis bovis TaxID=28903 RepID=A0A2N8U1D7_MYCBV|nr:alpha/beta hydrolase [Mycoplasmopsis bovis]AXJ70496.1 alpha/beta hydrolase [Mycoplasmopsis bovis]AXJ71334.1 alpha/beta hydrolase [Mycoplasmopsis bovis]AXJ72188.1 alpha/beta hydrolase [Mycoplasmopsis bovis]AXJ73048.1 alpha/beta hydrolase [Mycoplasmopsis bovis]AXJ74621.1 alpha/beta hydrolase [Mycoplasmopsis bovis]
MNSTVLIKNEKIHYIFEDTSNDIPVLLFVHGFKDRSKTIQPLISIKNRNYAIYALDLPGCGESSSILGEYSIEFYAEVVREFITRVLLNKRVILMGHSMGAAVSLMCFDLLNVLELILVAPFNYNAKLNAGFSDGKKWMLPESIEDAIESYKALVYNPNPFYIKGIQAFAMQDVQNREATKKMFSYIVDNQFFNTSYLDNVLKPLYHSAKKPYTLIYAKNDQFTTEAEMLKLIDDIPSITPYALDECGHAVFFQKANKVNEIVTNIASTIKLQ